MKKTESHSFDEAMEASKSGKRISRASWPEGQFVFTQVPSEVPETIIPKMSSLPSDVKAEFVRRGGSIRYQNQRAIANKDQVIEGWHADLDDETATNWIIWHEDEGAEEFTAAPVAETAGTAKPTE